jgi:hypothetical protein
MNDTQSKIGKLLDEGEQRDAIHVAVAPVVAARRLAPGQHVGLANDGRADSLVKSVSDLVGIVDPFLPAPVFENERCWLFLYPQTVTDMRHHWQHPSFQHPVALAAPLMSDDESWLRNMADSVGISYQRLLSSAEQWVESKRDGSDWPEYLTGGPEMEGAIVPDEFWDRYEKVTGERVAKEHRGSFFSCSC